MKRTKSLLGCAVLGATLLAGTACGSSSSDPTCETASAALLKTISAGSKVGDIAAESGKTLKPADHDGTYLVAAKISVAGAEQTGVWATSNLNGEGSIWAVDAKAKEVTSFADAAQADAKIGAGDASVSDVKACL
jgi:hypothetical protein